MYISCNWFVLAGWCSSRRARARTTIHYPRLLHRHRMLVLNDYHVVDSLRRRLSNGHWKRNGHCPGLTEGHQRFRRYCLGRILGFRYIFLLGWMVHIRWVLPREMGLRLGLGVNLLAAATGAVARPLTLHALQRHVQPSAPPLQVVLEANAGPEAKVPQQLGQVMTFNHLQLVYVDGLI